MPKYFYTAKSLTGETKSGFLMAKDETELARLLRQDGYILVSSNQEDEELTRKAGISLPFTGKISLTEKMMFLRNLQVMVRAGISLPRALRILTEQARSKKFKDTLISIADEIDKGKTFSSGLNRYPDIFSEIFVNMVKVGEESGTLEEVLKTLTQQMEREHELQSKVIGALIYPAVIIAAMMGIGILMLVMVVPKLAETFRELNIALPPTTRFVMGLGTFLAEKWFLIILAIPILFFVLRRTLQTTRGKRIADTIVLRIPVLSSIVVKTNSASMTRTLSSMIIAGIPIVRALEIVSGALGNSYFKEATAKAAERVSKGAKLSEAMKPHHIYPIMVIQMMEVGEETGQTSDILMGLADFYEEEVTNATKNLSSIIEPVLMILVGGAVGFFAISMIQPMYSMLRQL